jgi:hypothetical protein
MNTIEAIYIDKGTFQAGDEDCSGLKEFDEFVVLKKSDYTRLMELGPKSIGDGFFIFTAHAGSILLKDKKTYLDFIRKTLESEGYSVSTEPMFEA